MAKELKADQLAQIEFIKDCLRKGEERKDILPKFSKIYQKSDKTFHNRLCIARKLVQAELEAISVRLEGSIQKEVESRKMKIMGVAERIEILSKIAAGEIPLTKYIVCDGVIEERQIIPDWNDRRNAIAELNKMGGDYAPQKIEQQGHVQINITRKIIDKP